MIKLDEEKYASNVGFNDDFSAVVILDQTLLPNEEKLLELTKIEEFHEAIYLLMVRGAPCIGIFAAFASYIVAKDIKTDSFDAFYSEYKEKNAYLNSARPTAVNLSWALKRMERVALENKAAKHSDLLEILKAEAIEIQQEDIRMCKSIASYGLSLLKKGDGLLTHCNAGPIATSKYGTALGPMLLGAENGYDFKVFADETRPLLQGARLTSWELDKAGIDVTLICDNMASVVMRDGFVQACLVGCDRVAANGDTANKIGTNTVAILAKHYGIPFYVLGPTSTIDFDCPTGKEIEVEQRKPEEVKTKWYSKPMAPEGVKCYNPAFDVTDNSLITAIVTEQGICYPPFTQSIGNLVRK